MKTISTLSTAFRGRSPFVALLAAPFLFAACGDSPTENGEHHEPVMVTVELEGSSVATFTVATNSWGSGHIDEDVGNHGPLVVKFISEDGDVIVEEDAYLDIVSGDASIAAWSPNTPGGYEGSLVAQSEGETTWTIRLMHGAVGSGHADLETTPLEVHIEDHQH